MSANICESTANVNVLSSASVVEPDSVHQYNIDSINNDAYPGLAIPPWLHLLPSHPHIIEYIEYSWQQCDTVVARQIGTLGGHVESFIQSHSAAMDELLIDNTRNARIRGYIIYDARLRGWYSKLVPHRVTPILFFRNYATRCLSIINGEHPFLTHKHYMSNPLDHALGPLGSIGSVQFQNILHALHAARSTVSIRSSHDNVGINTPQPLTFIDIYDRQMQQIKLANQQYKNSATHEMADNIKQHEKYTNLISIHVIKQKRQMDSHLSTEQLLHAIALVVLVVLVFIVPILLMLLFYLDIIEVVESGIVAIITPVIIWLISFYRLRRLPGIIKPPTELQRKSYKQCINVYLHWIWLISQDYVYESYHVFVTLVACGSYLWYTYEIQYTFSDPSTQTGAHYSFRCSNSARLSFIQVECFLVFSLALDYAIRFVSSPNWWNYFRSKYSLIDLLCFIGVAYFPFILLDFRPEVLDIPYYNIFLFQGWFRFLRLRRAIMSLDHVHILKNQRTKQHEIVYMFGPLLIKPITARVILLSARIILYIVSTASLVMFFEFPCISFYGYDGQCKPELQQFELCIYFIVVTLSTVGYGDLYCVTVPGRMFMVGVIVVAAYNVPRVINDFAVIAAEVFKNDLELENVKQVTDHTLRAVHDEAETGVDRGGWVADELAVTEHMQPDDDNCLVSNESNQVTDGHNVTIHDNYRSTDRPRHRPNSKRQTNNERCNTSNGSTTDNSPESAILSWCELRLRHHHGVDTILELCTLLSIDVNVRSEAAKLLVTKLFTGIGTTTPSS